MFKLLRLNIKEGSYCCCHCFLHIAPYFDYGNEKKGVDKYNHFTTFL